MLGKRTEDHCLQCRFTSTFALFHHHIYLILTKRSKLGIILYSVRYLLKLNCALTISEEMDEA